MIYNDTLDDYKNVCSSYPAYIVLFVIFLISMSISSVFIYFHWYLKRKYIETTIYWTYKWDIWTELTLKIEHITLLMILSILKTLTETY